ncbi:MAG: WecB/TagA/CpsF family glycosyltransferase [Candidatus Doudnabacteria bacterium]|nr:WecB/TagA/CpsF family glycosyltransferase [Candidatus Doudnabacteria bacterium]
MKQERILGIAINNLTTDQLISEVDRIIAGKKAVQLVTVNAEFLVAAQTDFRFREVLQSSAVNTADGIGILWAASYLSAPTFSLRFLGSVVSFLQIFYFGLAVVFSPRYLRRVIKEKLSGVDLIWLLAGYAVKFSRSIFLLGGYGDTSAKVAAKLKAAYPNLRIVGIYAGSPQERGLVNLINRKRPDILLVAFGPVAQEKWISQNLKKLSVGLAIGLGGTFDYLAGKRPLAPKFLREIGLEWAFRLVTQPYRLKRVINAVPVFIFYAYRYKLLQAKPYRRSVSTCLINPQRKILICRRTKGRTEGQQDYWQLPRGGLENDEDEEAAARREVGEELGIPNFQIMYKLADVYKYDWTLYWAKFYNYAFRGQVLSIIYARIGEDPIVRLDNFEFDAFRWSSPSELLLNLHPTEREFGAIVLKHLPD